MSLTLNLATEPPVTIKTGSFAGQQVVFIQGEPISLRLFLLAVSTHLMMTPLTHGDPRRKLVLCVRSMEQAPGRNPGGYRLLASELPINPLGSPSELTESDRLQLKMGLQQMSMIDLMAATYYVLTNTDLVPGDPRPHFVRHVKSMREEANRAGQVCYAAMLHSIPYHDSEGWLPPQDLIDR